MKLEVYKINARGTLYGINQHFYPRWSGWKLLYEGASQEVLLAEAESFYMTYFYYPLKLDLIEDSRIAECAFQFATLEGKKKLVSKFQKATGSRLEGTQLVEAFNKSGTQGKQKLLLEFLDHYSYFNKLNEASWVLEYYRSI